MGFSDLEKLTQPIQVTLVLVLGWLFLTKYLIPRVNAKQGKGQWVSIPTRLVRLLGRTAKFTYLLYESSNAFLEHWKATRPKIEIKPTNEVLDRPAEVSGVEAPEVVEFPTEVPILAVISKRSHRR